MEATMKLKEFLDDYGESLAQRVTHDLKVLHQPGLQPEPGIDSFLDRLGIKPFPSQREIIKAVVKALREDRRGVYLTAEMGTGKTLMSIAVALLLKKKIRTLVLCPPHLVRKWIAEVKKVWPACKTVNLNGRHCLVHLEKLTKVGAARGPEFYVIGRERAKTGYMWRPAVLTRGFEYLCPRCGQSLLDQDGVPLPVFDRTRTGRFRKKHSCPNLMKKWAWDPELGRHLELKVVCGERLWQPDLERRTYRKAMPAHFIKNRLRGFFDLLIADEVQHYKNQTGQGWAFAALDRACAFTLCLTGTLAGGYASDIFYLLFRTHPSLMKQDGSNWRNPTGFMERYGVLERITTFDEEDGLTTKAKKRTVVRARPGISPLLLGKLLLPNAVFLRLADCTGNLAPYDEDVVELTMEKQQASLYQRFEQEMRQALIKALAMGDHALLGSYLNALLSYPDRMHDGVKVFHPHTRELVAEGPPLDIIKPKESELSELVRKEVESGRRCLVYIQNSLTTDISPRLVSLLADPGLRVKVLRSGDSEGRDAKIKKWVAQGLDVLICNPRLVETGLDLLDFPTVIFYQTGYSTYTLRQAARRSWRIPQKLPVKVFFLAYAATMQTRAMKLMADKLTHSLALEGELSDQGLAAISESGDSLAKELAKMLVDRSEDNRDLKDLWAGYRKKELRAEAPLAQVTELPLILPKAESGYPEGIKVVSLEAEQVGDRVIKVEFIEFTGPRKKKVTHVEVKVAELDQLMSPGDGQAKIQFSLF